MHIPTLTTERLVLRPFRESDVPAIERLLSTPEISRQTRSFPHPLPEGWALQWVQRHPRLAEEGRRLHWAIADHEDRVIGTVSLSLRLDERLADLGYWMGVDSWGHGYTTEACIAVRDDAFDHLGLERLEAAPLRPARVRANRKMVGRGGTCLLPPRPHGRVTAAISAQERDFPTDRSRPWPTPTMPSLGTTTG